MVNSQSNPFLFHLTPWLNIQRSLGEGMVNTLIEGTRPRHAKGNLYQDEDGATWVAQIPGLDASSLELSVEGRVLNLKTKVTSEEGEAPDFEQTLRMPFEVDGDRAEATLKHGLLLVRLPKVQAAKTKRIDIAGE